MFEYRQETGKAALAMFLSKVGLPKVKAVFEASFEDGQKLTQYIILLRDGGHICTCLQLVNKGIVCAHYFRAMRADHKLTYHISLIPRRWFREDKQDEKSLEDEIRLSPLVSSASHNSSATRSAPAPDYLKDYLAFLPSEEPIVPSAKPLTSAMQRYAMMQGRFKKICQDAADNELWSMRVDEALEGLEDFLKGAFTESLQSQETNLKSKRLLKKCAGILGTSTGDGFDSPGGRSCATFDTCLPSRSSVRTPTKPIDLLEDSSNATNSGSDGEEFHDPAVAPRGKERNKSMRLKSLLEKQRNSEAVPKVSSAKESPANKRKAATRGACSRKRSKL
ncbi:hypothetical protein BGZ50_007666 [Haplosporangium sp. Z 11]|nr:hypothetical protein BGZ50_007666 [Haplosporangium sp. Z 11]